MSAIASRAEFNFIRYANVWEDADILVQALAPCAGGKMLSIASAGDNSFSLLTLQPEVLVAVDLNPVQLALVDLKYAAIKTLSREECIAFLGFTPSESRVRTYQLLRNELASSTTAIFDTRAEEIAGGIIHHGKFERYFQTFANRLLPLIHSKKTTALLFELKTAEAQLAFYENNWNTWRWRLLFKIFFSKPVMGRLGRDPEFLNEVKVPVGQFIFNKAEQHLSSTLVSENHMLRYQLTAGFGDLLPHYLQEKNYALIQSRLGALHLHQGYAEEAIAKYGQFRGMNLSNIFEYMPQNIFQQVGQNLNAGLENKGKLAYWNLMVPRKLSRIVSDLHWQQNESERLGKQDKGFFYSGIVVDQKE
jgi:S-adenosylmethionine-diacylglycerol 3-amino-3-carboxypropyl transferase